METQAAYNDETYMDEFAAECLDQYGNWSSTDSSSANDIAIWSLVERTSVGFKLITDRESRCYKKYLQDHQYSTDAYVESMRTPMSELLKKNMNLKSSELKQTHESNDDWKSILVNRVEGKIRKKSMSLVADIKQL